MKDDSIPAKKPKEPKKLTAKQQAKADALAKKLGLVGDLYDVAAALRRRDADAGAAVEPR